MLELVGLSGFAKRKPKQLSGGQQQACRPRRALVNHLASFFSDEPLGALDLKLRKNMQMELKRIQQEVVITFVHVTHDQEEARRWPTDRGDERGEDRAARPAGRALRAATRRSFAVFLALRTSCGDGGGPDAIRLDDGLSSGRP